MSVQAFLGGQVGARLIGGSPARQPLLQARSPRLSSSARRSRVAEASPASTAPLTPAVLPGTPAAFLIPADRLVALAKAAFATQTGVDDDSVLAPDFRFEFPVVSLDREAYLKAVRGFGLKEALPDLQPHAYDWRVDPFEPNRVWYTIRTTATHTGTLRFGRSEYKATGRQVLGAPECCSYCFDDAGKVVAFTGGYVMDRRVGNTGGLGALFGILHAIGVKVPKPGSFGFSVAVAVNNFVTWLSNVFGKKAA